MDIGALMLPLCATVPLDERDRVTVARQALALFVSNSQGGHFCCSVIQCGCQENYCASIVSNCALRDRFFCCILAVCLWHVIVQVCDFDPACRWIPETQTSVY